MIGLAVADKPRGRPKAVNPATARLPHIRVTEKQLKSYKDAADIEGILPSAWVKKVLDAEVKRSRKLKSIHLEPEGGIPPIPKEPEGE